MSSRPIDSYSNTHDPMSRSVASISEIWICNFSTPRNESGIHGSGGIIGGKKEMVWIGGLVSGEIHCSGEFEFLWTRTSPDEWLCGTCCKADSPLATIHMESGTKYISFNFVGDSVSVNTPLVGEGVEISTGSAPPGRQLSALCKGGTLAGYEPCSSS